MSTRGQTALSLIAAAAVWSALAAMASANAAPTADGQGYVDSTARCASPNDVVVFGRTATSRVAICASSGGRYEYRGVRVRDGAKLIASASQTDDGGFTADNDGITYTVTEDSLVISARSRVIRKESMVDFHRSDASDTPAEAPTPTTPLPPPLPAEVGHGDR